MAGLEEDHPSSTVGVEPTQCPGPCEKPDRKCGADLFVLIGNDEKKKFCPECGYRITPYIRDSILRAMKQIQVKKDETSTLKQNSQVPEFHVGQTMGGKNVPVFGDHTADVSCTGDTGNRKILVVDCKAGADQLAKCSHTSLDYNPDLHEHSTVTDDQRISLQENTREDNTFVIVNEDKDKNGKPNKENKTAVLILRNSVRQEDDQADPQQSFMDAITRSDQNSEVDKNSTPDLHHAMRSDITITLSQPGSTILAGPPSSSNISQISVSEGRRMTYAQAANSEQRPDENVHSGEYYNKTKQPPPEYVTGKPKIEESPSCEKKTLNKRNAKVTIYFKVIVSKDFDYTTCDGVYIAFLEDYLGGWCRHYPLTFTEYVGPSFKYAVMKMRKEVPRHLLKHQFRYKYLVKRRDKVIFEKVFWSKQDMRELNVPPVHWKSKERDSWYQTDCMMYPKPDSNLLLRLIDYIKSSKKKFTEEARFTFMLMLPQWKHLFDCTCSGEAFLKLIANAHSSAYNCFVRAFEVDEIVLKEVLVEYLEKCFYKYNLRSDDCKREVEQISKLVAAVCVISIIKKWDLQINQQQYATPIFRALLIRSNSLGACTSFETLRQFHFQGKDEYREIEGHVASFTYSMAKIGETDWIMALPLLHFLCGDIEPYGQIDYSREHTSPKWWGTKRVERGIGDFQAAMKETNMPVNRYLDKLEPLFRMDKLLPRTLMAVVGFKYFDQLMDRLPCHPEVYLAHIYFNIKSNYQLEDLQQYEKYLNQISHVIAEILPVDSNPSQWEDVEHCLKYGSMFSWISIDVLELVCQRIYSQDGYAVVAAAAQSVASCMSYITKVEACAANMQQSTKGGELPESPLKTLASAMSVFVYNWMEDKLNSSKLIKYSSPVTFWNNCELKIFSSLLSIKWHDNSTGNFLHDRILRFVEDRFRLASQSESKKFIELYCTYNFSQHHEEIEEVFSNFAFSALDRIIDTDDCFLFRLDIGDFGRHKLQRMLSSSFRKKWERTKNSNELECVLSWASFSRHVALYYKTAQTCEKETFSLLEEDCETSITIGVSTFEAEVSNLFTGGISLPNLSLFHQHIEQAKALFDIINKKDTSRGGTQVDAPGTCDSKLLERAIRIRRAELERFRLTKQLIGSFVALCQVIVKGKSGDLEELSVKLQIEENHLHMDEICQCTDIIQSDDVNSKVVFFGLPAEIDIIMSRLNFIQTSTIFQNMWHLYGRQALDSVDDVKLKQIVTDVWEPAHTEYLAIKTQVNDGSISFENTAKAFSVFENANELRNELDILCEYDSLTAKTRLKQIQELRILHQYKKGAKTMLKIKKLFKLKGNFETVEVLAQEFDQQQRLGSIDDTLISAAKLLEKISPEKEASLATFCKCKKVVDWLKQEVKGPKEVKVLVDLAMISSEGQGDYEVEKVSCLHAAVTGYAPLIYDLNSEMGFDEFIHLCEVVWRALAADPNLPTKLETVNQHLSWLKNIKESHGSVEVNVIAQVQAINARGIFQVGNMNKSTKCLEDVIKLFVMNEVKEGSPRTGKKSEDDKARIYTVSELMDLQSKLMLVAGKGEKKHSEEVERFVEIYEGILRLASSYLEVCAAGSILFENWKCSFYCNKERPVVVKVEIVGLKKTQELKGERNQDLPDVGQHIIDICTFVEECLSDWKAEIKKKRTEFCCLNLFTTAQLVILRNEMATLAFSDEGVRNKIYPMLHCVKNNCTKTDVRDAIKETNRASKGPEFSVPVTTLEIEDNASLFDQETENFIQRLIDQGFSRKLAEKASESHELDEFDDAMFWCLEKAEEDSSTGSDDSADDDLVVPSSFHSITGDLIDKATKTGASLKNQLVDLWSGYLQLADSSVSDYLSLDHLGKILTELKIDTPPMRRPFPDFCKPGNPNLFICNERDMIRAVLTVYMLNDGKRLQLPGADEVLYCNENTSVEEAELFFHRAMEDQDEKVYCLVAADQLPHDVSQKAEEALENLRINMKQTGETKYRLVVICSRENQDKAHIVAALDRHRVQHPHICSETEVKEYLQDHYRVAQLNASPAGLCDSERMCVRLVKSHRAGEGKSHYIRGISRKLKAEAANLQPTSFTIPLQRRQVQVSDVLTSLLRHMSEPDDTTPRLIHLDVGHDVVENLDFLLFNLLVLGSVTDSSGYVWIRSSLDMYMIEAIPLIDRSKNLGTNAQRNEGRYVHQIFKLLPTTTCWSPCDSLEIMNENAERVQEKYPYDNKISRIDQLMDEAQFRSEVFQRPFQYLHRFHNNQGFKEIHAATPQGNSSDCLDILIRYCGLIDPSWSELKNFICFLNVQLLDCEHSIFCHMPDDLPGFLLFVVKFMIQMSKDFATRSLRMSEETPGAGHELGVIQATEDIEQYQLKKRWETSPHPYVFFNRDHVTMTFLGFDVERKTGNILDSRTRVVLERGGMPEALQQALHRQRVVLKENFDALSREVKIMKMCYVMGIPENLCHDPDPTYELTADNVKKILAIYMRFRCEIPVVIMGETGCGKTRLIKFMCDLQMPPYVKNADPSVQNMVLVKVHGGTTETDIERKVGNAIKLARDNRNKVREQLKQLCAQDFEVDTVLFFDEANTTEAIGLIKEIMCDGSIHGKPIDKGSGLKIVAACNPYRKHTDEMIEHLEQAGLGYHVDSQKTHDKLGRIPMRQLVYRVQPLPRSMLPLVWDFGQLSTEVEEMYIRQMVLKHIDDEDDEKLDSIPNQENVISSILAASQQFMRQQTDECSFVSLRDVERTMRVMVWFYKHRYFIFPLMDGQMGQDYQVPTDETRSLILALGVCYHACLTNRDEYRRFVAEKFLDPCILPQGPDTMLREIDRCQEVFLNNVKLGDNIAKNRALKENLFMMVVCIELRIPLFLVGKPGSSKSLAKTIVADAMQRDKAHHDLFKSFKEVHMVSYQCSPLSTPDGIVGTFRQCAKFQRDKDLDTFVSVVVLDEVGLAEDSPLMPLKTLHPLLEDGCEGDEMAELYKKVAFIGISNWALDPAKMNRGIHVQRGIPDEEELVNSARGICATDMKVRFHIEPSIKPMAKAYLELYKEAMTTKEFFGLRDFYSLVKMLYGFSKKSNSPPTWHQMKHAIMRNFGGLDSIKPVDSFAKMMAHIDQHAEPKETDPDSTSTSLIEGGLHGDNLDCDTRYLLILTENYAALSLLEKYLLNKENTVTIFGSSFPKDQEYTQVCRNINRIKVCMETGKTVVLLNLDNLYESLYDALNQYYVYLGDERFVDLGLGTQRVKCRVHPNFRLVVVAEKNVVYEKFPIPLINRLEKHFLAISTILSSQQIEIANKLNQWADDFASNRSHAAGIRTMYAPCRHKMTSGDVFIGYNADTAASIVLQVCEDISFNGEDWTQQEEEQVLERAKRELLQCATLDGIVRLSGSRLPQGEVRRMNETFLKHQHHDSLGEFLMYESKQEKAEEGIFAQVTTHSRLLSKNNAKALGKTLNVEGKNVQLENLQAFDNEQQFSKKLKSFYSLDYSRADRLMILQCDSGDKYGNLLACARHIIWDKYVEYAQRLMESRVKAHFVLIVHLQPASGGSFVGFEGGRWTSYHIDELLSSDFQTPDINYLKGKPVSELLKESLSSIEIVSAESRITPTDESTSMDVERQDGIIESGESEGNDVIEDDLMRMEALIFSNTAVEVQPCGVPMDTDELASELENMTLHEPPPAEPEEIVLVDDSNKIDFDKLMTSCIHSAASMVKDAENADRQTHRLQMLIKLLGGEGKSDELMQVLQRRITRLQADKEQSSGHLVKDWLAREVASRDRITEAGTFRRSFWQALESKVTQLLAGLIAFADTNANLDILGESVLADDQWLAGLWLAMFDSYHGCELKYQDLRSIMKNPENPEFPVRTTGYNDLKFRSRCPFSWVIRDIIGNIIYHIKTEAGPQRELAVCNIFSKSEIGKCLSRRLNEEQKATVVQHYLHDFVWMVYRAESSMEHELIMKAILCSAREMNQLNYFKEEEETSSSQDYVLTIPGIHLAFQNIQGRLQLFKQAVAVNPKCVLQIKEAQLSGNQLFSENEMTLDIQALWCQLEDLNIGKEVVGDEERRNEWADCVDKVKPIIQIIFSTIDREEIGESLYGKVSKKEANKARFLWNRIQVVRLFMKYICAGEREMMEKSVSKITVLWKSLGESCDMKTCRSFKALEKVLKICNMAATEYFYGKDNVCRNCKAAMSNPTLLPCEHIFCRTCVDELLTMDRVCPLAQCQKGIPENFTPTTMKENKAQVDRHNAFKNRCNGFFMELVSTMCFGGSAEVEEELIKILMEYVTKDKSGRVQTRKMAVFPQDSIDPTPVVRSFLLQLLLRSNRGDVNELLQEYFDKARHIVKQEDVIELSLLIVHSLEDFYVSENSQLPEWDSMNYARERMESALEGVKSEELDIQKLEAIAGIRYAFSIFANWLYKNGEGAVKRHHGFVPGELPRVVRSAEALCENSGFKWPRLFLLNTLFRKYGIECLRKVSAKYKWILPLESRDLEDNSRADRYLVCGQAYRQIRELVAQTLISRDTQQLTDAVKAIHGTALQKERVLMLAIHREVTMSCLSPNQHERPTPEAQDEIVKMIDKENFVNHKIVATGLVRNRFGEQIPWLNVTPETQNPIPDIIELLIHLKLSLTSSPSDALVQTLKAIIANPQQSARWFFPTMADDNLAEIQAAILGGRNLRGGDHNPVLYTCPNGHPYVVGACGRPVEVKTCRACGVNIGGTNHNALPHNDVIRAAGDQTRPGHFLGQANQRSVGSAPERDLSPVSTATIRMLLHLTMLLAADANLQCVSDMIHPWVDPTQVSQFLLDHLHVDIQVLTAVLGCNSDDAFLFMHILLYRIGKFHIPGQTRHIPATWQTKDNRRQWEALFQQIYLTQIIQERGQVLQTVNTVMMEDDRLGANPLLRVLYEVDKESKTNLPVSGQNVEMSPAMWRYQEQITIQQVTNKVNEETNRREDDDRDKPLQLLQLFLQQHQELALLRLLPNIARLQGILMQRFNRNIDSSEALSMSVQELMKNIKTESIYMKEDIEAMIRDFEVAWEYIRIRLNHPHIAWLRIDNEYQKRKFDLNKSRLAMLLPSWTGAGLCAVAVTWYLAGIQNDFIEEYAKIKHAKADARVELNDLTSAHLVAFHPERDLYPIIIANCSYYLNVGSQTATEYDFPAMERQIEERFICGRTRIFQPEETVIYREDFTTSAVFEQLRHKIPQEPLPIAVYQQLQQIETNLPDLCESLAHLDTAIGFLVSVGTQPDMKIISFMVETLQMEIRREQAVYFQCHLAHVESIWLLLAHERAKRRARISQNPFDGAPPLYQERVPPEHHAVLEKTLGNIPLESFLQSLFDALTLQLVVKNRPGQDEEATDNANQPLGETLCVFIESRDGREIPALVRPEQFPQEILVKHAISVWQHGLKIQQKLNH